VVYRAGQGDEPAQLIAVEVVFAVASMWSDMRPLTNTVLRSERWFDYENHPTATFTCDRVEANAEADEATHTLHGSFTLNGITHALAIPATLSFVGQTMTLEAEFEILRSDYKVEKRDSSLAGTAGGAVSHVHDEVALSVRMVASPDVQSVLTELATLVDDQAKRLETQGILQERLFRRLEVVEAATERIDGLEAAMEASRRGIDLSSVPSRYTDHAPTPNRQVPFEMVLVPGDDASGIEPFYMATTEVTWAMLEAWSYGEDIKDLEDGSELMRDLIASGLRPTPLYGDPKTIVQMHADANPAMAVTKLTAQGYCKWLSEQTGRRYRLATEDEWVHAFTLGGGMPDDLAAASWHRETALIDDFDEEDIRYFASPAGTKAPNALGIYDMLGNVSEWVIGTGTEDVVRGGSYITPAAELGADWREVADWDEWNAGYSQRPYSRFWYTSHYRIGIRLVCEAWSVAENPPATEP